MLTTRPDAKRCTDVPDARRIMPYLMPTRTEATVGFEQALDVTHTLALLEQFNARRVGPKATLFHVYLWAIAKTLTDWPRLNRFVAGGAHWQRDGVWLLEEHASATEI